MGLEDLQGEEAGRGGGLPQGLVSYATGISQTVKKIKKEKKVWS